MRKFVVDTSVLLANLTDSPIYEKIELKEGLERDDCAIMLPVVVKAEIMVFSRKKELG